MKEEEQILVGTACKLPLKLKHKLEVPIRPCNQPTAHENEKISRKKKGNKKTSVPSWPHLAFQMTFLTIYTAFLYDFSVNLFLVGSVSADEQGWP